MIVGNRPNCRSLAEQFEVDWQDIGDDRGGADPDRMTDIFDEYDVDYVVLARYMRVLPAELCWKFAGGRIINLHHDLFPDSATLVAERRRRRKRITASRRCG